MSIETVPQYGERIRFQGLDFEFRLPSEVSVIQSGEQESQFENYEAVTRKLNPYLAEVDRRREEQDKRGEPLSKWESMKRAIGERWDRIEHALRKNYSLESAADDGLGSCISYDAGHRTYYILSVKKELGSDMKFFAYGHEAGHCIEKAKIQDQLQSVLDNEGIKIDVTQYHDEDFADLVGFLALYQAKKAGDNTIRIPFFKTNPVNREKMGREFFGLGPSIDPNEKPKNPVP